MINYGKNEYMKIPGEKDHKQENQIHIEGIRIEGT